MIIQIIFGIERNNLCNSHPLPALRNLKRHLIRNAHRLILTNFLIRQVIGSVGRFL